MRVPTSQVLCCMTQNHTHLNEPPLHLKKKGSEKIVQALCWKCESRRYTQQVSKKRMAMTRKSMKCVRNNFDFVGKLNDLSRSWRGIVKGFSYREFIHGLTNSFQSQLHVDKVMDNGCGCWSCIGFNGFSNLWKESSFRLISSIKFLLLVKKIIVK